MCETCPLSFQRATALREHRFLHSDERPYVCKTCALSFKRPRYLRDHERIHSTEKPYVCRTCSETFNRLKSWRNHERKYSGHILVAAGNTWLGAITRQEDPVTSKPSSELWTNSGSKEQEHNVQAGIDQTHLELTISLPLNPGQLEQYNQYPQLQQQSEGQ